MYSRISAFITLFLFATSAFAGNVDVDLNVQIGNPEQQQKVYEIESPSAETVYIEDDVEFIYPGSLGFYVGVGTPFDLFFINNFYFSYRNGYWYKSRQHRGPWAEVKHKNLPSTLRKHKIERLRHYRDREYVIYEQEGDHYRGRHFRTGKGELKEDKKRERDERKDDHGRGNQEQHGHGNHQDR